MRIIVIGFIIIINFIFKSTFLESIAIFNIMPNISLLTVVSFAIMRNETEGAVIGFFTGLLEDIIFGKVLGYYALVYMVIGYFCGKPFRDFYRENYLLPLALIVIATLSFEFVYYVSHFLFRGKLDLFYYFWRIMLPVVGYNAFLTLPVYRILYGINNLIEEREKRKRRLFKV